MLSSFENNVSISRAQLEGFYHSIEIRFNNLRYNLADVFSRSCTAIETAVHNSTSQLDSSKKLLSSLDPRAILSRGYSITRINGKVVKSPDQYSSGDTIVIQLHQGKISLKPQGKGDANDNSKQPSVFKYSEALKELEAITTYLESSDVDLDEAIKKFDRGSELASQIEAHLKNAENKIKTIRSKN